MVSNNRAANMAEPESLSFDQYKQKYSTIQTSIAVDNADSVIDLQILINWLEYFKNGFCSEDETQFLLISVVPKITRILLKRKFAENAKQFAQIIMLVEEYLITIVNIIGNNFSYNYDCFSCLMAEILDPNQFFYQKYASIKFDPPHIFGDFVNPINTAADVIILGNEDNTGAPAPSISTTAVAPATASNAANMKWVDDRIPLVSNILNI